MPASLSENDHDKLQLARTQFAQIRKKLFYLSFVVFIIPFYFYLSSQQAIIQLFNSFSITFFFSAAIATLFFYFALFIYAELYLPKGAVEVFTIEWLRGTSAKAPKGNRYSRPINDLEEETLRYTKMEISPPHEIYNSHADVTNPISPIYQITHRQHDRYHDSLFPESFSTSQDRYRSSSDN